MIAVRRRARDEDEGFTLLELIVTTSIFSVVLVAVLGAIISIYSATNRVDQTAAVREQLGNSFRRLDKEIRYASWISIPGQVGTRWYLEYAMPDGCRQLVYNNGVLTLAKWTLPGTTPGAATTIATDLSLIGSTKPFTLYPADSRIYASLSPGPVPGVGRSYEPEHTLVRMRFNATVGRQTQAFDVSFTAQNNNKNTPQANDCSKGRPTS